MLKEIKNVTNPITMRKISLRRKISRCPTINPSEKIKSENSRESLITQEAKLAPKNVSGNSPKFDISCLFNSSERPKENKTT